MEFWSDPFLNTSDVTFMLHPNQEKWVKKKLSRSNIPFKVSVSFFKVFIIFQNDYFSGQSRWSSKWNWKAFFQKRYKSKTNILISLYRERKENSYCVRRGVNAQRRSNNVHKRATIWDELFNFFNFGFSSNSEEETQIHRQGRIFCSSWFCSPVLCTHAVKITPG